MNDVLKPPVACSCPRSKAVILVKLLMLIGEFVSCRISYFIFSYLFVSCSGLITSDGEERAIFMLLFTCICVFVRRGFLFNWCLG